MRNNQIAYHSYADDAQIYLALSPNDSSPIDSLCQCIDEIKLNVPKLSSVKQGDN